MKNKLLTVFLLSAMFWGLKAMAQLPVGLAGSRSHAQQIGADTVPELGKNIMGVFMDSKGRRWFLSWETGLYCLHGKTLLHYGTRQGLASEKVTDIREGAAGEIFVCVYVGGLMQIQELKQGYFETLNVPESSEWKDAPHYLYMRATEFSRSVFQYDGKRWHRLQIPKPEGINNDFAVYSVYRDSKGYIWFGTNPLGACRFNDKRFEWITEPDVTELHGGPANGVRSIIEDLEGHFWFNTEYKYRVYGIKTGLYHGKEQDRLNYRRLKSISSIDNKAGSGIKEYLSITRAPDNALLIATYSGGVWRIKNQKAEKLALEGCPSGNCNLFSLYKDPEGVIWLGTHSEGAYRYNGKMFKRFRYGKSEEAKN